VKPTDLESLTTSDLVKRFAATGIEEDKAEQTQNQKKRNNLRLHMFAIAKELKRRPGDHRRALSQLYDHPNMEVRLLAAKCALAVDFEKARQLIEEIAGSRCYPQAGDAGMCLLMLDRGEFVPD